MILKSLSLLNYKNIASAELDFSGNINCFIGKNGEGKTNMLDSIYFLSFCKSSSTSIDSQVILHDKELMGVRGIYEREDGETEDISCGLKRGQKKIFRRGKKAYKRLSEHIGLIPLVMISPSDEFLILGGSEVRRKFMDQVISQYDATYLDSLVKYNKALQHRNALLKSEAEPDADVMCFCEEQMALSGEHLFQCRDRFVHEFIPIFQQYHREISQDREQVSLTYISHAQRGPLLDVISQGRMKDRVVGYSLHGVHRDDLEMNIEGYPIKREGSQGQNKTYMLAMKLAQFDFLKRTGRHTTPLLLLDDIFDKLDASRVQRIIKLASSELLGQLFITDTNREHLDQLLALSGQDYKIFHVENGVIRE